MDSLNELEKLSKSELIALAFHKGWFFGITENDIIMAKIEVLSKKANIVADEAIADQKKYSVISDKDKWELSQQKFNKAMKMWNRVDALYDKISY